MSGIGSVGGPGSFPDPAVSGGDSGTEASTPPLLHGPFANREEFNEILSGERTVGWGDRGAAVRWIEEALVALGYGNESLHVDYYLARATEQAIMRFQRENGLTPSGVVDAETLVMLDRVAAGRLETLSGVEGREPVAADIVPPAILERYGLETDSMRTESRYEGDTWSVSHWPYAGDVQYGAFAKHGEVFGREGTVQDGNPWFSMYSNPPSGLSRGSWIGSGTIRESDFAMTAGVDILGKRMVDDDGYRLLRQSGAPSGSRWSPTNFEMLDAEGKQLPVQPGDRLVPTVLRDGEPARVEAGAQGSSTRYVDTATGRGVNASEVVWRIQREDGAIVHDPSNKVEGRNELLGLEPGIKFDFLDSSGSFVSFNPDRGDRIVPTWKDGEQWHVLAEKDDGSFEHQVIEDGRVASTTTLDAAAAAELRDGKDIIHRVQNASGELQGSGSVGNTYDMAWWGKCHNTAALGISNIDRPQQDVSIVTNLEEGDEIAFRVADRQLPDDWAGGVGVLRATRDESGAVTGTVLERRDADGAVLDSLPFSRDGGGYMTDAAPVIVTAAGALRDAEVATFNTHELDALVSHIGDGATERGGGDGHRYYNHPDILVLADGRQLQANILEVKTESGETETIGRRANARFHDEDRSALRSPDLDSRVLSDGSGRRYAFNVQDMSGLNQFRDDPITELKVVHPDGTEETIDAADVGLFAWENKFAFNPEDLWKLHGEVSAERSVVIEEEPDVQVWNYAIKNVDTEPLTFDSLTQAERDRATLPGQMTGTVGAEGKYFFQTNVNNNEYRYWVRFDDDGNVEDYAYLMDRPPDFTWSSYVQDPYENTWAGESQAPGIPNSEIQRLYLASVGALDAQGLPFDRTGRGGVIMSQDALRTAEAVRPASEE